MLNLKAIRDAVDPNLTDFALYGTLSETNDFVVCGAVAKIEYPKRAVAEGRSRGFSCMINRNKYDTMKISMNSEF
jgi:hypothetical protein